MGEVGTLIAKNVPPCANCGASLQGEWCHQCGQHALDTKAATWSLVKEWFEDTFDTDSRIPRTVIPFLFRPGFLVREYLAGKRVAYTSPLGVYAFSALVSFFILSSVAAAAEAKLDVAPMGQVRTEGQPAVDSPGGMRITIDRPPDEAVGWFDERIRASTDRLQAMPQDRAAQLVLAAYFDAAPKVLSLLVPVFAAVLKLFWPRRTSFEHAIFSLNLHALTLLAIATCALLPSWALPVGFAFVQIHLLRGLWRVYQPTRWGLIARYLGISLSYGMVLLAAMVATLLLAVMET